MWCVAYIQAAVHIQIFAKWEIWLVQKMTKNFKNIYQLIKNFKRIAENL